MTIIKRETIGPEPTPVPEGYAQAGLNPVRWECKTCGAGVIDHQKHTEWHQSNGG